MEDKLKHRWWFPLLFLLLQLLIYISGILPVSTDFREVYFPNALNHAGEGPLPYGLTPDGSLNRFGTMPPGYSILLSILLTLGASRLIIFSVLALLGSFLLYVWQDIARALGFQARSIYIYSGLFLLYPLLAVMAPSMGSEMPFAVCISFSILALIRYIIQPKPLYIYMASISLALATEIRLAALGLLFLLTFVLIIKRPRQPQMWIPALLLTGLLCIQFHAPVYQYYLHRTMLDGLSRYPDNAAAADIIRCAAPSTRHYLQAMSVGCWEALLNHPFEWITLAGMKLGDALWAFDSGRHYAPLMAGQLLLLVSALWYLRHKPEAQWWIPMGGFVYFWLLAAATFSICRYLMPVFPVLLLFPVALWQRHRS